MYVCPKNFGAAWRCQKWLDLAEILHTCSLGEYLGDFFFILELFFVILDKVFGSRYTKIHNLQSYKMAVLGQYGLAKKSQIYVRNKLNTKPNPSSPGY